MINTNTNLTSLLSVVLIVALLTIRYEKVLYQKLPTVDSKHPAVATAEEGSSSSDEDLLNPSSSNPFQNT